MKKMICGIFAAVCMMYLFCACEAKPIKEPPKVGFLVPMQFDGYRVGYVKNLNSEEEITSKIDSPELVKYSSVNSAVKALRNNKIHGLVLPARYANEEVEKNKDLSKLYQTLIEEEICAITLAEYKFSTQINAAVTRIMNDGTADKIAKANSEGKSGYARPKDYEKVEGRVLRVGVPKGENSPLIYKNNNGELCGINVDTAYEMAKGMYADIEISEFEDDKALFKALDEKEIDIALSAFVPSEENPISVKYFYTHPYSEQSVHILINGPTPAAANGLGAMLNQK